MEDEQWAHLKSKEAEKIESVLKDFNTKNAGLFDFTKFHVNDQWYTLWNLVFAILRDTTLNAVHRVCLNTVRILTRDGVSLQKHNIVCDLSCLVELAQLTLSKVSVTTPQSQPPVQQTPKTDETVSTPSDGQQNVAGIETIVETLKCLCNLVFQSADCRRECVKSNVTDAIVKRISSGTVYPTVVELYDMKLLFLITALEPSARTRVQIDSNGVTYMTEWLDEKLSDTQLSSSDEQLEVMCEVLKVMFNITTSPDKSPNESEIQNLHLTGVIRKLLLRFGGALNNERQRSVVMHAINLLTNMSSASLMELLLKYESAEAGRGIVIEEITDAEAAKIDAGEGAGAMEAPATCEQLIFEGWNVLALDIILRYLRTVLEVQDESASSNELLAPVLTVLVKCARSNRTMRHYIRSEVLPPLRDVSQRPEVGDELRNHLTRFLTLPSMVIRDLAADLLFVCCKENVARMVKYTGYGNAAGLFAKRGLLDCRRVENAEYSSDSEDSDTEEYKQVAHGINPVLGCYEEPKTNPLEGMSEEQKEYEAVQLANLMDKLHRGGIVQPCRIGEDGKPVPVDHILQLQEELPQQQFDQKQKT